MNSDLLSKFARELKSQRESQNITLEQIHTKTRIDKKFLVAIEEGNFSVMPEVYTRAFIKEYAQAVGLNPNEVIEKYSLAIKGITYDKDSESVERENITKEKEVTHKIVEPSIEDINDKTFDVEKSSKKTVIYILTAVIIFIAIFSLYKLFLENDNNRIITEKPFEEVISEKQIAVNNSTTDKKEKSVHSNNITLPQNKISTEKVEPSQKNNSQTIEEPLKKGMLTLTILGTGKSWIRAVSDNENTTEFIIEQNSKKVIYANERFYLHIGNSAGVRLFLNNKDLLLRGAEGKVRKVFVTKEGINYLRRTPVLNNAE